MRTVLTLIASLALLALALLLAGLVWPRDPACLDGPCDTHDLLYIYGFLGTAVFGGLGALIGLATAIASRRRRRR